jgi:hypothetical protein
MLWISETALPCASAVTIAIVSPVAAGPAAGIEARREMPLRRSASRAGSRQRETGTETAVGSAR